ncbi:MAG: hypothetical protein M3328_02150, partial [Chloroflexota bacterium]|nr:hypothetical protein [Chloroflexota bacterium]
WLAAVPVALGLMLLMRIAFPGAWPASFGLNLVVVVGSALALGGALAGTIVPQSLDTMRLLDLNNPVALVGNIVLLLGVVCALAYFAFGARAGGERSQPARILATIGRWVLLVAFGALLGSLSTTFFHALIDRLLALIYTVVDLIGY